MGSSVSQPIKQLPATGTVLCCHELAVIFNVSLGSLTMLPGEDITPKSRRKSRRKPRASPPFPYANDAELNEGKILFVVYWLLLTGIQLCTVPFSNLIAVNVCPTLRAQPSPQPTRPNPTPTRAWLQCIQDPVILE